MKAKRPLGRPGRRWERTIKMDLKQTGYETVYWIHLVRDTVKLRELVNEGVP